MSRSFLTHRANPAVAQIRKSNLQISPLQSARGDDCDLQTAESTMFYRRSIFTSMAFLMGQVIGFERAKAGETPFWRTQSGAERVVALEEAGQIIANGVVWDDEGHIVSSYITFKEILRKNSELKASSKGLTGTLEVVGFDPTLDIIVFLCDKSFVDEPLRLVTKGYRVGTSVISLVRDGESEDGFFVGKGILSGLGRTIIAANGVKMPDLLQTDAPVSIMSAGSGLFQPDGALLGIFTPGNIPFAKFRSDSGVNFIIPGSTLKTVVPRLLKHG
jgi:S1-C subfamily serine protease